MLNNNIKVKTLLNSVLSLLIGSIITLIFQNLVGKEIIEFSTIGLIGFTISIIFGGTSIFLAITAINLGRKSEEMMINRSEKSIELQNDVYIKTAEALKK